MNVSATSRPPGSIPQATDAAGEYGKHAFEQADKPNESGLKRVLDPYLHWAQLTDYRYLGQGSKGPIRLALAMRGEHTIEELRALNGVSRVAAGHAAGAGYCTVQIERDAPKARAALLKRADFVLAEPGMWPVDTPARKATARAIAGADMKLPEGCGRSVVVGVIDGRCAFANARFCDAKTGTHSLIDFFWDQAESPVAPWQRPAGFGYGRELTRQTLDAEFKERFAGPEFNRHRPHADAEKALYRALGQALPADADWSHGSHVLDTVLSDCLAEWPGTGAGERPGVIYVQLPDGALRDTSARWAASYVLDALHYILSRAGNEAEVVVNLSLGAFAGPHDGSSLLERAIDDLIERLAGRLSVVVAAGNTGLIRDDGSGLPVACQARATLGPATGPLCDERMKSVGLEWHIDCADSTESFMEIWLPQLAPDGRPAEVEVSLARAEGAPGEAQVQGAHAEPGQIGTISCGGRVMAAVLNASGHFQAPNGRGGLVLVALGHTRDAAQPCARMGRWIVSITNRSPWPITLDAYIERRDMPGDLPGFRPQYGFAAGTTAIDSGGSLGSFANGAKTIVAGAAQHDSASGDYTASDYSAGAGRGRREGCNARFVLRRGADLFAAGQREAVGFLSGSRKSLAGTSMAAAQVSAALAAALACAPMGEHKDSRANALDALGATAVGRSRPASRDPGSARRAPILADADVRLAAFVLPAAPKR